MRKTPDYCTEDGDCENCPLVDDRNRLDCRNVSIDENEEDEEDED